MCVISLKQIPHISMKITISRGLKNITHNGHISQSIHNKLVAYAKTIVSWSKFTQLETAAVKQHIKQYGISYERFMSLRSQVIKNYILGNYNRVNSRIDTIVDIYDKGQGILEISAQFKHPPVDLLRMIFQRKGYKSVNSIITGAQILPSTKDNHELNVAKQNDIFFDDVATLKRATDYENAIESMLKQHNIKYKTQATLSIEQTKRYGNAVSTPDFVFLEPVYFNGHRIYWLDVKDYYYVPGFMTNKLSQQGEKYDQLWGPGALLFHHGYSIPVPRVTCF